MISNVLRLHVTSCLAVNYCLMYDLVVQSDLLAFFLRAHEQTDFFNRIYSLICLTNFHYNVMVEDTLLALLVLALLPKERKRHS